MKPKNESHMSHDARLAVLETTILNINSTLDEIKHSFQRIDRKFDSLEDKIDRRFNEVDKKFDTLENKMDSKFNEVDKKFDALENKLESKIDTKFDLIQNRLWSNFLWLMGMIIGLAGLIAHTQKWI